MLEGDLGDFSIAEILQLLGFTRKSGRLQLHGRRSAGRMIVAEGGLMDITADVARVGVARRLLGMGYVTPQPIFALLEAADELPTDRQLLAKLVEDGHLDAEVAGQIGRNHALESLAELLRWTEGSFRFEADRDAGAQLDVSEALPAEDMMAEANQRLAGWDQLADRVGSGDQVVILTSPMPPRDVTIPAAAWGILMFIDGQRTVDELATLSGRGAYDTRVALVELLDQGLVALGEDAGVGEAGLAEALARVAEIEAHHHPGAAVDAAAAFGAASREEPTADQAADDADAADAVDDAGEGPDGDDVEVAAEETTEAPDGGTHVEAEDEDLVAELSAIDGEQTDDAAQAASLRTKVRGERLRQDPTIDEDLVARLIDGVEGM